MFHESPSRPTTAASPAGGAGNPLAQSSDYLAAVKVGMEGRTAPVAGGWGSRTLAVCSPASALLPLRILVLCLQCAHVEQAATAAAA